jgi:hypothetical protein
MPGTHAFLSASGAKRWMACTPSAQLESTFPQSTSTYADEGTLAHALGELTLRKRFMGLGPRAYAAALKRIQEDKLFSPEMTEHVKTNTTDA